MATISQLNIVKPGSSQPLAVIKGVAPSVTIGEIKKEICKQRPSIYVERQSLRLEKVKGKNISDSTPLASLTLAEENGTKTIYFKDLGPQIGWSTVFLCEYFGPLVCYMITYTRPTLLYGQVAARAPYAPVVHIAAACWSFHYAKRLLETLFVHRFSHSTMPINNLFKNCTYYWGFATYIGYYINHPLYTEPWFGRSQVYLGLAAFIFAELGNFSIHLALRNLRPAGSKERKIPHPTANPFTALFSLVSCPNYTYEGIAWAAFTIMTQAAPAGLFAIAGFGQMAIWALGKHRNYKKEFSNYPKSRKAIIPFIL